MVVVAVCPRYVNDTVLVLVLASSIFCANELDRPVPVTVTLLAGPNMEVPFVTAVY
jgi:hypothetical protein